MKRIASYAPAAQPSTEDEVFQQPLDRASEAAFKSFFRDLASKVRNG